MTKHPKIVFDHPGEPKKTPRAKPEKSYKGLNPIEREVDGDYQRDVENWVNNNVHYCISWLISEMSKDEKYQEDLWPVLWRDDWEESAIWWIDNEMQLQDMVDYIANQDYAVHDPESLEKCRKQVANIARGDWHDFACDYDIDSYTIEAYEHWIVSDWFADKLEEKGQMILKDFNGLTIWGRTTTGQSIHMDSVICNIYNESNAGDI